MSTTAMLMKDSSNAFGGPSTVAGYAFEYRSDTQVYSDLGTTLALPLGVVEQWNDISGNSRNQLQTTLLSRPLYNTNELNGKPGITFDGSNDFMSANFTYTGDKSIFIVMKHITWTQNTDFFDGQTAFTTTWRQAGFSGSPGVRMYAGGGLLDYQLYALNTWAVVQCDFDFGGSSMQLYLNNTAAASAFGASTNVAGGFWLGGSNSTPSNFEVAHIIGYNAVVSASDRTAIEGYLNGIYAIH